jgi:Polysaccharide pyruvyl transferase
MFKSPLVVGIRQFENWEEAGSVEATLDALGKNSGNMMFMQALLTVLDGARWGSYSLTPFELDGRDVIVLASANWINGFEDFGWLAERLEKTSLPVVLVGVGAQASLAMEIPRVKPGTLRLLSLVRDRSKSIAARGTFSCDVLSQLGFNDVVPTGCPSLLLAGREGPSITVPEDLSFETTCVHATRHGVRPANPFEESLYRLAFREKMDIILQSETPDIYGVLGSPNPVGKEEQFSDLLMNSYGSQDVAAVSSYLRRHGHAFTNFEGWVEYMRTKAFCFGTRIHGTVASLIAGTAATLIAHDSRTLEMAKSMSIPYVLQSDLSAIENVDLRELLLKNDILGLLSHYHKYFVTFIDYFRDNDMMPSAGYS